MAALATGLGLMALSLPRVLSRVLSSLAQFDVQQTGRTVIDEGLHARLYRTAPGRLSELRHKAGVSKVELSRVSRVSRTTIDKVDRGGPSQYGTLNKLRRPLNVHWTQLLLNPGDSPTATISKQLSRESAGEEFGHKHRTVTEVMVKKCFSHADVESQAHELVELCTTTKQNPIHGLLMLWQFYTARAEHSAAWQVALTMEMNARKSLDTAMVQRAKGECCFYKGDFHGCLRHLEHEAIVAFSDDDALAEPIGLDPRAAALGHAAIANAILGRSAMAAKRIQEALRASNLPSPDPSFVFAEHCASVLCAIQDDPAGATAHAESAREIARTLGFQMLTLLPEFVLAWGRMRQNQRVNQRELLAAFNGLRMMKARVARPFWMTVLARAVAVRRRPWVGLHLIDDAIEFAEQSQDSWYLAECIRNRAELLHGEGSEHSLRASLAAYEQAIEVAKAQRAPLFHLRAAAGWFQTANRAAVKAEAAREIRVAAEAIDENSPERAAAERLLAR